MGENIVTTTAWSIDSYAGPAADDSDRRRYQVCHKETAFITGLTFADLVSLGAAIRETVDRELARGR